MSFVASADDEKFLRLSAEHDPPRPSTPPSPLPIGPPLSGLLWIGDLLCILPPAPKARCLSCSAGLLRQRDSACYLTLTAGDHSVQSPVSTGAKQLQWPGPMVLSVVQGVVELAIELWQKRPLWRPRLLGSALLPLAVLGRGRAAPLRLRLDRRPRTARPPLLALRLYTADFGAAPTTAPQFHLRCSSPALKGAERFKGVGTPFVFPSGCPPLGLYYKGRPTPDMCRGQAHVAVVAPGLTAAGAAVTFVAVKTVHLLHGDQSKAVQNRLDLMYAACEGDVAFGVAVGPPAPAERLARTGLSYSVVTGRLEAFDEVVGVSNTKQRWSPALRHREAVRLSVRANGTLSVERSGVPVLFEWVGSWAETGPRPLPLPQTAQLHFAVQLSSPRYFIDVEHAAAAEPAAPPHADGAPGPGAGAAVQDRGEAGGPLPQPQAGGAPQPDRPLKSALKGASGRVPETGVRARAQEQEGDAPQPGPRTASPDLEGAAPQAGARPRVHFGGCSPEPAASEAASPPEPCPDPPPPRRRPPPSMRRTHAAFQKAHPASPAPLAPKAKAVQFPAELLYAHARRPSAERLGTFVTLGPGAAAVSRTG